MLGIIAAVEGNDIIKVQQFIAAGEDVNQRQGHALILAVKQGLHDIAEVLLSAGANPNVMHQISIGHLCRFTPLCYAVLNSDYKMIDILLQKDANILLCNPTLHAVDKGDAFIVKKFLSRVDLLVVKQEKFNLKIFLKTAVSRGHLEVSEILLNAGCDLTNKKYNKLLLSLSETNLELKDLLNRKIRALEIVEEPQIDIKVNKL